MSTTRASLRSIQAVENWFRNAEKPFWTVWTGFSKDNKDVAMRNNSIEDIDKSWELLNDLITSKTEGGGRITIFLSDKQSSSYGYTEYLEIPGSNNSGISGAGNNQGFIGGVDAYINDKIALYDKDRQIEDLRAQLAEKQEGNIWSKTLAKVLEEAPISDLILAAASKYLGPMPNTPINGAPRIQDDLQEQELGEEDQERIRQALMRISIHFPNLADAIEQLAAFVEKNPAMAQSFLKSK